MSRRVLITGACRCIGRAIAVELTGCGFEIVVNYVANAADVQRRAVSGAYVLARIPLRRVGRPDEVAAEDGFLFSERASYIAGQVLSVNGGLA